MTFVEASNIHGHDSNFCYESGFVRRLGVCRGFTMLVSGLLSGCVVIAISSEWVARWHRCLRCSFVSKRGRCGLCGFLCGIQEDSFMSVRKGFWVEAKELSARWRSEVGKPNLI